MVSWKKQGWCLYVDRGTWGTTWEAAHDDCHRKEDLGSRKGGMGQEGMEAGGLWWGLPFQCTPSLLCFLQLWTTWASAGSSGSLTPHFLSFLPPLQQRCRIKQDAPHHKRDQQDHPVTHTWVPPLHTHLRADTALLQTLCHRIFTVTLGAQHIILHGQVRRQLLRHETMKPLPEVTGRVRGGDGDLNSTWD